MDVQVMPENLLQVEFKKDEIVTNQVQNYSIFFKYDQNKKQYIKLGYPQKISSQKKSEIHSVSNYQIFIVNSEAEKTVLEIKKNEETIKILELKDFHQQVIENAHIGKLFTFNEKGDKFLYVAQTEKLKIKQGFEIQEKNQDDLIQKQQKQKIQSNNKLESHLKEIKSDLNMINEYLNINQKVLAKNEVEQQNFDLMKENLNLINQDINQIKDDSNNNKDKDEKIQENEDFSKDFDQFLNNNKYVQSFGEKLTKVTKPSLFEYDIQNDILSEILIDDNIFPGRISYVSDDQLVFGGQIIQKEFKYGLHLCNNRESNVYLSQKLVRKIVYQKGLNKKQQSQDLNQQEIKSELKIISRHYHSFFPIVNNAKSKIYYYGTDQNIAHQNYMSINEVDIETLEIQEYVPIIEENLVKQKGFMGILGYPTDLTYEITNDDKYLFFSTQYGGCTGIFKLDLQQDTKKQDKSIQQIDLLWNKDVESSINLIKKYDDQNQKLYILNTSFKQPHRLISYDIKQDQYEVIDILSKDNSLSKLIASLELKERSIEHIHVQSFMYSVENVKDKEELQKYGIDIQIFSQNKRKLVNFIHGGPHGNAKMPFNLMRFVFILLGYRVLTVNFSGSGGYGQKFLEKAMGKCGEIDAKDIIGCIEAAAAQGLIDMEKIGSMGNSYGGYMSAILASRFSEYFKCSILMNPVLNMPFSIAITDIPEWNVAEVLGKNLNWNLQEGEIKKMYQKSPFSESMKIPIMLMLGQIDQRVPHQAAFALRAQTIFNGGDVQTYLYNKADHSLGDSPQTDYDVNLKCLLYMENYLG